MSILDFIHKYAETEKLPNMRLRGTESNDEEKGKKRLKDCLTHHRKCSEMTYPGNEAC